MSDPERIEIEGRYLRAASVALDAMTPAELEPWLVRGRAELQAFGATADSVRLATGKGWEATARDQARVVYLRDHLRVDVAANAMRWTDAEGRPQTSYSYVCGCVNCRERFAVMLDFRPVEADKLALARKLCGLSAEAATAGGSSSPALVTPTKPRADWSAAVDEDEVNF